MDMKFKEIALGFLMLLALPLLVPIMLAEIILALCVDLYRGLAGRDTTGR